MLSSICFNRFHFKEFLHNSVMVIGAYFIGTLPGGKETDTNFCKLCFFSIGQKISKAVNRFGTRASAVEQLNHGKFSEYCYINTLQIEQFAEHIMQEERTRPVATEPPHLSAAEYKFIKS